MNPALAVSGKGKAGKVDARKKPEKEQKKVIRSHLKQPKQAPSAWQLFFAEELSKLKAQKPEERLNVAHVAKGAGERYNMLPDSEKAKYHKESLRLKAQWERDMQAWKESLSPEDIKLENAYRTQQRKAGKSRKSNLKDPHAPKKPLSAYFLFLRAIRSDPKMTDDVFGKEGETTKQSVLAAAKWRELSDTEKQPFLAKADQDKLRYEEARRVYESAQARGVPPAEAAAEAERAGKAAAQAMADKNPTLQALQAAGLPAGISFNMDDESNNPKHHLNTAFDDADDSDSRDQVGRDQHLQTKGSGRAGTGSRATKAERIG
ncbi:HMG-box [Tilletiaria anomala UBC 951]|uniref:HMG-box n=1 Tax=Tilletiaria anomala (strain ATCC 24038 / CBS 436.72 / UBC 951) TaxID=1037660 RepID=A0A066W6X3_TILAU|nr:HMG-box [Tilletiaria anomala UBC 951]KDN46814.1 HMG-box [Tilletiaria anomala UBC 951]